MLEYMFGSIGSFIAILIYGLLCVFAGFSWAMTLGIYRALFAQDPMGYNDPKPPSPAEQIDEILTVHANCFDKGEQKDYRRRHDLIVNNELCLLAELSVLVDEMETQPTRRSGG